MEICGALQHLSVSVLLSVDEHDDGERADRVAREVVCVEAERRDV